MRDIDFVVDLGIVGEITVHVDYDYSPGRPAVMHLRNGDPGYPEEPAEINIFRINYMGHDLTWLLAGKLDEHDPFIDAVIERETVDDAADAADYARQMLEDRALESEWDDPREA